MFLPVIGSVRWLLVTKEKKKKSYIQKAHFPEIVVAAETTTITSLSQ